MRKILKVIGIIVICLSFALSTSIINATTLKASSSIVRSGKINDFYSSYNYGFNYSGRIYFNDTTGAVQSASKLSFSKVTCNTVVPGSYGCVASPKQAGVQITVPEAVYTVNVDLSAKTSTGALVYVGYDTLNIYLESPGPSYRDYNSDDGIRIEKVGFTMDENFLKNLAMLAPSL